ncbi:MAG: alpha/beta fold hydrolase [Acidobacteria bacterium]|nr:alpha/beta fold hydrolase [Acidobacteriota bacterium]
MFVTIGDSRIYAESRGEGPEIVFIHGLGGTGSIYFPVANELSDSCRTVLYDWSGSGASSRPHREYSIPGWADEAKDLCVALGIDSAVFVGHSMGAAVAVTLAARYPELAFGIILLGPVTKLAEAGMNAFRDRAAKVRAEGMGPIADVLPNGALAARTRESNPAVHGLFRAMLLSNDPECYALHCEALMRSGADTLIPEVQCPALLIAGEADPTAPPAAVEAMSQRFPSARTVLIGQAGHAMQLDQPGAVAAAIREFV